MTDLTLTERMIKLGDGTIETVIDVWFQKPDETGNQVFSFEKARIYLSDNAGASWQYIGETTGTHFAIKGDLIDGTSYRVSVVSVSSLPGEKPIANCPYADIELVGKSAKPSDITTFLVNQSRDRLYFGWTEITDTDLAGYEIRFGTSWASGTVLVTGKKGNNHIELNFRIGDSQAFFIKAIDTSGNYSETAKQATVTIESIPFSNLIESYSEQTAWGGTKSNTSKVVDNLEIDATYLTGTYVTAVKDLGYLATFKIGIEAVATVSGDSSFQDFGDETFGDQPETERFSGSEQAGALSFEIKTSEDNVTWTDFAPWQAGDYTCRYFQIRMTMTRASTSQDLECSQFNYYADLPDIDDKLSGEVTVAADGDSITFTKDFHETPYGVNVVILTGAGVYFAISSLDTTGCIVKLYDAAGTAKTGIFNLHVHGV